MKRGGNPNGREETVEVGNMRKGSKGGKGNRFWNGTGWYDKTVLMITIEGMR